MYPLGKTVCYMSVTHIAFIKEGNQIHPTFEKCGISLFSLPSSANQIYLDLGTRLEIHTNHIISLPVDKIDNADPLNHIIECLILSTYLSRTCIVHIVRYQSAFQPAPKGGELSCFKYIVKKYGGLFTISSRPSPILGSPTEAAEAFKAQASVEEV